jgi:hypothetical protein
MPKSPKDWSPAAVLADELLAEKAAALGRLGRGLEQALAALKAHDAGAPEAGTGLAAGCPTTRAALVDAAAYALWMLMVQREASGIRDARALMRDYGVPAEVQARAGAVLTPPHAARRAAARREGPGPSRSDGSERSGQ